MKLLTIVIPIYKVEAYIKKCLDSLIIAPELMEKMDVIIINDGTPDRSAEISREYVKRFPGVFRQIDKENGGHGSVWNLGLKEAEGKYTRFLDSDDWLENLDLLIEKLKTCDADLVLTTITCHLPKGKQKIQKIFDMEYGCVYDADSFDWLNTHNHPNFVLHHSCTYKTEIIKQYLPLFLEKQPYDDMVLSPAAIIGAKSLVAYDFVLYHYLMDREGQSISQEVMNRNIQAITKSQQSVIDFIESHRVPEDSSKATFYRVKLPKLYNYGYKFYIRLPYREAKSYTAAWDDWRINKNPLIKTKWISLYKIFPYWVFRLICKVFIMG